MDFQNLDQLASATAEPEALTPLRYSTTFQIAQDSDDDLVQKIPHGLTAKKNRRKSFNHTTSNAPGFSLTPQRAPLTAPRPNVLNSHPIGLGFSPINQTKRSLMSELKAVRNGKENSTWMNHKSSDINIETDEALNQFASVDTPSSPERLQTKRRSSVADFDTSSIAKQQKVDNVTVETEQEEQEAENENSEDASMSIFPDNYNSNLLSEPTVEDSTNIEIDGKNDDKDSESNSDIEEPEEFSRIEAFNSDGVTLKNPTALLIENETSNAPITPSRLTEPVAQSPKTEQCSRVVDESQLLLDTSKPPLVDDSYRAPESPLSQHQSSIIEPSTKNLLESLDEIAEVPSEDSPKPSRSTPKARPFFTISQIHEIQEEFKNKAQELQDKIRDKINEVKDLNDILAIYKNKEIEASEKYDSLNLQKMQILKDNDLLKAEFTILKSDISELELSVKSKEDKLSRHKTVINKFKERVREIESELAGKQKFIEELEAAKAANLLAEEEIKDRADQYEKQIHFLSYNMEILNKEKTEILSQKELLRSKVIESNQDLEKSHAERREIERKLNDALQSIQQKELQIQSFTEETESHKLKIQELENNETLATTNSQLLIDEIKQLTLAAEQKHDEFTALSDNLTNMNRCLNLKTDIIKGIQGALFTLRNDAFSLKTKNQDLSLQLSSITAQVEEANESLMIRKAEVDELDLELKQAKNELSNLHALVSDKNAYITELNDTITESSHALESKNVLIQKLEEDIQKQEGEHLSELESFHQEMTSLQATLTNKSSELYKLREEKGQLQREHEKVKYELSTTKDEHNNSDIRISNLKLKLNDLKSQNNELEEGIQSLKAEKSTLESETDKRLQQLAEDLYIQYSKKHEQKVQVLKKNYEAKWHNKLSKAESENERLRSEITGLKSQLERESEEKNEIIKLWDQFKEKESSGMPN